MCIYNILNQSPVDGTLGYSHVLAIVNSAAMNIGVHAPFKLIVFSRYMPRMRLQDHIVILFLVFLGNFHIVLHSDCANLHATNSEVELLFLHTLSSIYYLYTF